MFKSYKIFHVKAVQGVQVSATCTPQVIEDFTKTNAQQLAVEGVALSHFMHYLAPLLRAPPLLLFICVIHHLHWISPGALFPLLRCLCAQ